MASYPPQDRPPLPAIATRGSLTPTTRALQVRRARAGDADGAGGGAANEGVGYSGAGWKLRSSRRALGKKKPYDRPASSGRLVAAPSIPSGLVDSATRLISSSASYLFSSFFNRRPTLAIGNGVLHTVGAGATEVDHEEGFLEPPTTKKDKQDAFPNQGPTLDVSCAETERKDLDLALVEEILKQQLWSREQVNRLTEVLQTCVRESNAVSPNAEVQRWREQIKKGRVEFTTFTPVQVARAYMGECTLRTSGSFQSTHGPSSGGGLLEDSYRSSPGLTTRTPAAAVRTSKRRFIADDDDMVSRGPIRRVRQKMTLATNTSPYIRQVTAASGPLRMSTRPPLQSSQTAKKLLEALEKPPRQGKSVEEPKVATGKCRNEQAPESPESSKVREILETSEVREKVVLPTKESPVLSASIEPGLSSGKPAFEAAALVESEAVGKSVSESPTSIPGSPIIIPERTKGFRMSAIFEESYSDEESELQIKTPTSSEAQQPVVLSISKETPQSASSFSFMTTKSLPVSLQSSVSATPLTTESSSLPVAPSQLMLSSESMSSTVASIFAHVEKPTSTLPTMRTLSFAPVVMERGSPLLNVSLATSLSTVASSSVVSLTSPVSTSPAASMAFPAAVAVAVSSPVSGAAAAPAPATASQSPSLVAKTAPAVVASGAPPAVTALAAAAAQPVSVSSAAAVPSAGTAAPSAAAVSAAAPVSVVLPVAMGASLPPTSIPDTATAIDKFFEAENRRTLATESPGANKPAEVDTMATDPMTEELDISTVSSSAPAFPFGSASTAASTSSGYVLPFGAGAISSTPSTFSFAMQSSGPSAPSLSANFLFGGQSSTPPAGQLFTFGAHASSSPANSFLSSTAANSKPSFSFGSSAATSATPIFTATSSAPLSFPATSAAPSSFPFGMHAASFPLTNSSTLGFEAQMTPTASSFASTGAANSFPAFTFSASPASSATPFPFGAGAGTPMSSGSSFAAQSFTFGGQSTPVAANPFAPSGATNSVPFQFASPATTSAQSAFSFGANAVSTPSPNFAFGAQPTASPIPFTFGGQSGALPVGQPFGFGGHPTVLAQNPTVPAQNPFSSSPAPAQSPFPSAGAPGPEFAGGFALGATGGEKGGRKFIKAKRIGGVKRGK